jgi:tetratricopeptide (TPR) repeat protein
MLLMLSTRFEIEKSSKHRVPMAQNNEHTCLGPTTCPKFLVYFSVPLTAALYAQEGNLKRARKCFEAAVVACDTHAAAYHGWGQLELTARRYAAAKEVLLRGIKMTSSDPNQHLYTALANLAIRTGASTTSLFQAGSIELRPE